MKRRPDGSRVLAHAGLPTTPGGLLLPDAVVGLRVWPRYGSEASGPWSVLDVSDLILVGGFALQEVRGPLARPGLMAFAPDSLLVNPERCTRTRAVLDVVAEQERLAAAALQFIDAGGFGPGPVSLKQAPRKTGSIGGLRVYDGEGEPFGVALGIDGDGAVWAWDGGAPDEDARLTFLGLEDVRVSSGDFHTRVQLGRRA